MNKYLILSLLVLTGCVTMVGTQDPVFSGNVQTNIDQGCTDYCEGRPDTCFDKCESGAKRMVDAYGNATSVLTYENVINSATTGFIVQ